MQAHLLSTTAAADPSLFSIAEGPGLAHDAGNLLGALSLYADLLRAPGVLQPQHRHYAEELHTLSRRSAALIHRLISGPARQASGEPVVPVGESAADGLRALRPVLERMAAPDSRLTLRIDPSLPPLPFPSEALDRIVLNLVHNAAEALYRQRNPCGRIDVALTAVGEGLRLMVADNGPGLDPLQAARLFAPSTPDRIPPPGRGLGHRIVQDLVAATRGTLAIRVRPGQGSIFTITWRMEPLAAGYSYLQGAARS